MADLNGRIEEFGEDGVRRPGVYATMGSERVDTTERPELNPNNGVNTYLLEFFKKN